MYELSFQGQNVYLAIKKCKLKDDMTKTHREKWEQEVAIMLHVNHPNIVKAFPPPSQLAPGHGEPSILVMEYCSGGDLRQVSHRTFQSKKLKDYTKITNSIHFSETHHPPTLGRLAQFLLKGPTGTR